MVHLERSQKKSGRQMAIIFDFDGTIADSFSYVFYFLKQEAKNSEQYTAAQMKLMRQMSMRRLALHLGVPVWKLLAVYFRGRRYMRNHMKHVQPFAGMDGVIAQLNKDGYQLFIASANSKHNIRLLLKREGLLDYFVAVRGGAGFGGKTSLINGLMSRYRLQKATTWYVGDETADIVAATRAGIPCLAVTWGFANPKQLKELEPAATALKPADIPGILR